MSRIVRFELPLPPSMNTYFYRGVSSEGRTFRRVVELIWLAQRDRTALQGYLSVSAALWFPTMASDVDNIIKPTLDALQHAGVYPNDNKVGLVHFYRAGTIGRKRKGCMLIEIGPHEWKPETVAQFKAATKWEEERR